MPALASAAIAIQQVWKSYSSGNGFALRDVSLEVTRHSFVALAGASGSGKTTLLKLINRLIEPTRGAVFVDGGDVAACDAVQLRRRIGYVFQGIGLFPHLTVAGNIAVTPELLKWDREAISRRVDEMLELVRLPRELKSRFPATLSGGQAQRVGIARALAARPEIVLMDEPFGAVDPVMRDVLGREYRALHDALGLTTVMVSHDIMEAVLTADCIAVLDQGELVECGAPAMLLAHTDNDTVRELINTPLRQAERISRLAGHG